MSFTVEIASVSDRDDLVAEIWLDGSMVAELHRNDGKFKIDIYPNESGQPLSLIHISEPTRPY